MSLVLLFSSQEERELKLDNWLKTYFYLNFLVTLYLARVYVSFSSVEKTIMKVLSVDRTSTGIKSIHSLSAVSHRFSPLRTFRGRDVCDSTPKIPY